MQTIQISATFTGIPVDKVEGFKALVEEAVDIARGEPGVLAYDWFAGNDEHTSYVVREVYESSEAVLAHLGAVGAQLGGMLETGSALRVEVFGEPSPELLEAGAAFQPVIYSHVTGK
jgi:quinol monooxygenase YgiN